MSCVSQKSDQNRARTVCRPANLVYAELNVFVHTTKAMMTIYPLLLVMYCNSLSTVFS